jgi:cytochrome c-type biogenesis protein CcmE
MKGKLALTISIAIVLSALGFLIYTGLSANMVYYFHVDEFLSKASVLSGETIKINGTVAERSIQKEGMQYDFLVNGTGKNQIRVTYQGVVPDTFKEGSDVVVEGIYDQNANVFRCTTLMAKCPSKYEEKKK